MSNHTCNRCGGTGRYTPTGGRCYSCTGQADTSYTVAPVEVDADAIIAARIAERRARRNAEVAA